jgi:hypothetical protein
LGKELRSKRETIAVLHRGNQLSRPARVIGNLGHMDL